MPAPERGEKREIELSMRDQRIWEERKPREYSWN
jgi:hypothetical protein